MRNVAHFCCEMFLCVANLSALNGLFMSKKFCKFLRALYPEAYELALLRILAGCSIFFDHDNNPLYSEDLIVVCLLLAHFYVAKHHLKVRLTDREKRIWDKRFQVEILSPQKRPVRPVK